MAATTTGASSELVRGVCVDAWMPCAYPTDGVGNQADAGPLIHSIPLPYHQTQLAGQQQQFLEGKHTDMVIRVRIKKDAPAAKRPRVARTKAGAARSAAMARVVKAMEQREDITRLSGFRKLRACLDAVASA